MISLRRKDRAKPQDCAYVLEWTPTYMTEGLDEGYWLLQTRANYEAGTPDGAFVPIGEPRDADPADLADWLAVDLGYRSALTYGVQEIRPHHRFGHWNAEPVYYVSAAGSQS
jgi:hypothetical protein